MTLPVATDNAAVIHKECMSMIKSLQIPPSEYRGVRTTVYKKDLEIMFLRQGVQVN